PRQSVPVVTRALIFINALVFFFGLSLPERRTKPARVGVSNQHLLELMLLRDVLQNHHSVGVFDVFLQLREGSALCHYFRAFDQLAEPELFRLPINHGYFSFTWSLSEFIVLRWRKRLENKSLGSPLIASRSSKGCV